MNAPAEKVTATVMAREALSGAEIDGMRHLLSLHFAGVTPEQFRRDLEEKNRVVLLRRGKELVGFSTLLAYQILVEGETVGIIYSGDTIVAPEAWGTMTLPRAWIGAVNRLRSEMVCTRCYWLLLASGFRTYRFLPVFWKEFHPRFGQTIPWEKRRILEAAARGRFGARFDPVAGIVRFDHPQQLVGGLECVPQSRLSDPHVAFFIKANSGHFQGDELVCLAELCESNLTRAGRRMAECHG
jgi:hypothetical protein